VILRITVQLQNVHKNFKEIKSENVIANPVKIKKSEKKYNTLDESANPRILATLDVTIIK
jgi:hypothetical protein